MRYKTLVARIFENKQFESQARSQGLAELAKLTGVERYSARDMTAEHAAGVIAVIADSALFHRSFYEAAKDLRIIARWGVGYDKVNVDIATEHGVLVTIAPVHMDTVAEYTIAQWQRVYTLNRLSHGGDFSIIRTYDAQRSTLGLYGFGLATLKRVYTLNRLSHGGDFSIIRTYDAQRSTLGLYGFGRIGQQVAMRARPLLGEQGRLLVYDVRPDIAELARKFGAETVESPLELFRECDTVSLHVSGDETIVGYDELRAMRPHASLINPSRGNLVDDQAVHRAIVEERLCYYVVDDPVNGPREIHQGHPRIICTNHNGGITVESTIRLDLQTFEQVTDAIEGRKPNYILNPEVLDHPRVVSMLRGFPRQS